MGLFLPTSPSLCFAFTHAHSLSYNLTINPQPRPGQPWCEVQGQVDREVFLSMTVVLLTSHSRVPWENSGAEVPIVFRELEGSLVDKSPKCTGDDHSEQD